MKESAKNLLLKSLPFLRNHKAIISRLRMLRRYTGDPEHPNIMHIAVTDKCNMSCPFCLYRNDNKNFRTIGPDKAISLIEEIDSPVVLLSGGEPLIHGTILNTTRKIVQYCREAGKITGVLTNGVTLKKVLMSDYPEFSPGSRFFFQISIDGLRDVHDQLRGHFDLIMENIKSARDAGHLIYTNTVVSKDNIGSLNDIMQFVSGISDRIYLNPMVNNENILTPDGLEKLGEYIQKRQDMRIGNSVNFGKFLAGRRDLKCMFHSLVSITPTGKIKFPCYCYGEGSEYVDSFQEFIDRVKAQRTIFEEKKAPQCRNCYTHCLHEADVYARYYWDEIIEQSKRPGCLYKKYIRPLYTHSNNKKS
jgi:sulfatase maturation enzyme AslB (radical SAM superfamily)